MLNKTFILFIFVVIINPFFVLADIGEGGSDVDVAKAKEIFANGGQGTTIEAIQTPTKETIPEGTFFSYSPEEGLTSNRVISETGNTFSNVENYKLENGNILASYLEFQALKNSIFSILNPIDSTRITFNVPEGSNVVINNREPSIFEALTGENVKGDIIGKCPASLSFNSTSKQARLSISKSNNIPVYEVSNGNLIFEKENTREAIQTEKRSSAELDSCNGFICVNLAANAKLSRLNGQSFSISVPESGKEYKFCLKKKEGDGYIDKNRIKLDGVINFFNFNNDLIYTGASPRNKLDFNLNEKGIIEQFSLRNRAGNLIAYAYPSKSFAIKESDGRFILLEPQKTDYDGIKVYMTDTSVESPDIWLENGMLNQNTFSGNSIRIISFQNPEIGKILAGKSSLKYRGFLDG